MENICLFRVAYFHFQTSSNARPRSFPRFAHVLSVLISAPRRRAQIADIFTWKTLAPLQSLPGPPHLKASDPSSRSTLTFYALTLRFVKMAHAI